MSGYTREALGLAVNMRQVQERQRLKLAAAEVFDRGLAGGRGALLRFGKSGRMSRQISVVAVMNAVDTEGREVLKPEAAGYWKDQDRRYFGITEGARNVTAMKNRLGKVTYRKVYGKNGTTEYGNLTDRTDHTSTQNKNITIMVI
ncbi:MAG: hypothetical protein WC130_04460 [Kiritimatiellia bacterium]